MRSNLYILRKSMRTPEPNPPGRPFTRWPRSESNRHVWELTILCTRCLVFGDSMPGPKSASRAEWSGSRKRWLDGARYRGRIDHSRRSSCEELKFMTGIPDKVPKFKDAKPPPN